MLDLMQGNITSKRYKVKLQYKKGGLYGSIHKASLFYFQYYKTIAKDLY